MFAEIGRVIELEGLSLLVRDQIRIGTCAGCHYNYGFDCAKDIPYECSSENRPDKEDVIFTRILSKKYEPSEKREGRSEL